MVQTVNEKIPLKDHLTRLLGKKSTGSYIDRLKRKSLVILSHLLNKDAVLRFYVPIICLILIFFFAVSRGLELSRDYSRIQIEAKEKNFLIAATLTTQLNPVMNELDDADFRLRLATLLGESLPTSELKDGKYIFVTEESGEIIGTIPYSPRYEGRKLDGLISSGQPLYIFGARAGTLPVEFESGVSAIATVHHLKDRLSMVAVIQTNSSLFGGWYRELIINLVLYMVSSAILSLLIYLYFTREVRERKTIGLYAETQDRINMALSRGRCGLFDWDLEHGNIYWTSSIFELLGISPRGDILSCPEVAELVHPDDDNIFSSSEKIIDAGQTYYDRVFRMQHTNGTWIWIRARAEQVFQHGQDKPHIVGIAVDVTEQRKLEEASQLAHMRLKDAVEAISEAFVIWDANNRLIMCNSTYQELNGLQESEVQVGASYEEVMRAARRPMSTSKIKEDHQFRQGMHGYMLQLDDGRWLQVEKKRTNDNGWVSVGTDITMLKKNEAELKNKTEQLVELTRNLEQEKKRAEEANQTKSNFLANISHELRTPLNAIIGFSEIMNNGMFGELGSDKYKEYSSDIYESGNHLLALINNILDMSKIEAGRFDLKYELLNAETLLKDAVRTTTASADESKISVKLNVDSDLNFSADRRSIKQILLNIFSNAIKFSNENGTVTASAVKVNKNIVFEIEDTGIGIPAEYISKLGQPFVQVENPILVTNQGTGLGISIAQSLINLHGGKLNIKSKEGIGTKVIITVPLKKALMKKATVKA